MKKWIIAAVDLSEISAAVIRAGQAASRKMGGRLMVLHAVEALAGDEESGPLLPALRRRVAKVREEARLNLDRVLGQAGVSPGADAISKVAEGKAWRQIVQRAQPAEVALLVLGSPHPGIGPGMTINHVLHHCDVPVLVVKRPPHHGYRRVVDGLDFSEESESVLRAAIALAEEGTRIIGCHVLESLSPPRERSAQPMEGKVKAWAQARVRDVTVTPRVATGEPKEILLAVAREEEADLLAIGVRERGILGDLVLGPVAHAVMAAGVCDLLVARRPRPEPAGP